MKTNPAFVVYVINCLLLCLNLTFLWVYSCHDPQHLAAKLPGNSASDSMS